MAEQNDKVEYWPIGKEFGFGGSKFVYIPLASRKIRPFYLPRITKLCLGVYLILKEFLPY